VLLGAAGSAAQAQIKVPLSNPSRPVTLEMKIGMGDIHAVAIEGDVGLQRVEVFQAHIGIEFLHLGANRLCCVLGRPAGPYEHIRSAKALPGIAHGARRRLLPERQVDQRREPLPGLVVSRRHLHDVRDDADDRTPHAGLVAIRRTETLAKRLLARPERGGKPLVHHGDWQ